MNGHDTLGQQAPETFPCPECEVALPVGAAACPSCGIRLSGPFAAQLWRVNNQISGLTAEALRLRGLLLQPPTPGELAEDARIREAQEFRLREQPGSLPSFVPGLRHADQGPAPAAAALPPAMSGQQILLGIGALLLLSGVAFFLVVIWTMVGLVGQAAIMVLLTALAATGAAIATRRRLPATAETAAVIASGLLVLDLWSAHRLGLAGLDEFAADLYWAVAGVLGAAVLLGFDAVVPRRDDSGDLRRIVIYRPGAVMLLTAALWAGFFALDLEGLGVSLGALVVAVLSASLVWVSRRLARGEDEFAVGAAVPGISLVIAALVHLGSAVDIGYDHNPLADRMLAMALLLVLPSLVLVAQWLPALRGAPADAPADAEDGARRSRPGRRLGLRVVALTGFVVALGVPVMGADRAVVVAVAVAIGVLLTALALTGHDGDPDRAGVLTWGDLLTWTGRAVLPMLFWLVFLLGEQGMSSGIDMRAWITGAGQAQWWLPVLPALAFTVPAAITAVRRDSLLMAGLAHLGALVTVLVALRDAEPMTWAISCLVAAVVAVSVSAAARSAALEGRSVAMEPLAFLTAAIFGVVAVGSAVQVSAFVTATLLIALGAVLFAYAALPDRLPTAYLATLTASLGAAVLLGDQGADVVEYYTAPAVLMLAGIGAVQWSRDSRLPTLVTMGPALVVGLVPSLVAALATDSAVRLVAVTTASLVVLLVGMAQRWQAPVIVAGVSLIVLAVTQGGPLVAYVDGWVTLVVSGALLLAIGVMWERSIALGRRASAWLTAMQ